MPTLLQLDSSPLETAVSRELTREFVNTWKNAHPHGTVIYRDLAVTPNKPLDAQWIFSVFTPDSVRTPEQIEALALSDAFIAELEKADEYVIGVSMHNFTIPGTLKLWIDQIVRKDQTFTYGAAGPQGLLTGKKATFLVATGGIYELGTPAGAYNFIEPYLKTVFGFLGVTDTTFVTAGGTQKLMSPDTDRATFLQPKLEQVRELVA
jgi:FMN-dependent NADH-azoreductase